MSVRILLADDHKIMREGLKSLLSPQADFEIVAEVDDGIKALSYTKELRPDVVILDITMPNLNGIDAAEQIALEYPPAKIIALTMHFDKHFVAKMLRAGARGYLRKDCASEELIDAIRVVTKDKYYVSPHLGIGASGNVLDDSEIPDFIAHSLLSTKEREVLQLISEGKTTKEIAYQLSVSPKTIDKHRTKIMEKLDIHSIAELTKFAIRQGISSADT